MREKLKLIWNLDGNEDLSCWADDCIIKHLTTNGIAYEMKARGSHQPLHSFYKNPDAKHLPFWREGPMPLRWVMVQNFFPKHDPFDDVVALEDAGRLGLRRRK